MTRAITISIIVSFVAIAVFGFVGIEFMNSHNETCIVSTSQGGMCPEKSAPLDYINFHMNVLKSFSTAVFHSASMLGAFCVLLVMVLGFFASWRAYAAERVAKEKNITMPHPKAEFSRPSSPLLILFSHWLSLHENSPAFS